MFREVVGDSFFVFAPKIALENLLEMLLIKIKKKKKKFYSSVAIQEKKFNLKKLIYF